MSEFKGTLASPIGLLRLEATHQGLTAVRFPHNVSVSAERTIHNPLVAEAKQQLECPPVTPSTLRPGPEHALTTRGPSKRKRSR